MKRRLTALTLAAALWACVPAQAGQTRGSQDRIIPAPVPPVSDIELQRPLITQPLQQQQPQQQAQQQAQPQQQQVIPRAPESQPRTFVKPRVAITLDETPPPAAESQEVPAPPAAASTDEPDTAEQTQAASTQNTVRRTTAPPQRQGFFGRVMQLERRKNAWLRRTFLAN